MAVILAIDLGTSSVKASYIDQNLKILAETACTYPTSTPFQGLRSRTLKTGGRRPSPLFSL